MKPVAEDSKAIQWKIREIVSKNVDYRELLTEDSEARRVVVLQRVQSHLKLPSLSSIATYLQRAFSAEEVDISEIVDRIEADASIAARVLKLANSAYMRGSTEIDSLQEAAFRLGSKTLKQLIYSVRIVNTSNELAPGFDWTQLWKHNYATSIIAADLQIIFGIQSNLTRGIGLIHDLGKVILSDLYPAEYAQVIRKAYEETTSMGAQESDVFGITHEEVTAQFVVHNQFPTEIQEAIMYQTAPARAPTHKTSAALLQLANYFAKLHGLGYSGDRSYMSCTYDELEGWRVLLEYAGAEQKEMINRYEGYLRASLQASLVQARHHVTAMFSK